VGVDRERGEVLDFVVGACSQGAGSGIRWSGFMRTFGKLIRLFCLVVRIIPIGCEEFPNAGRWYFVGPPPAGGGRPRAGAAPAPVGGWRRPKRNSISGNGITPKRYHQRPFLVGD